MKVYTTKPIAEMSDREIINEMECGSVIAEARKLFRSHSAKIEQACAQRKMPTAIELRRMEFEAVIEIAKALGVEVVALSSQSELYAAGYEERPNEFAMYGGSTLDLDDLLYPP